MSKQQARRLRYGLSGLVLLAAGFGLAAWQFGWAQEVRVRILGDAGEQPAAGNRASGEGVGRTLDDSPEEYDLARIQADADYYRKVDPSRVWQRKAVGQGEDIDPVQIVGDGHVTTVEGGKLDKPLVVRAKPRRPVTFTALDTGHFANNEISITVESDAEGLASVQFWVTDRGWYRVMAGCPENGWPAEFVVQAVSAGELADMVSGKAGADYLAEQEQAERQRAARRGEVEAAIQARREARGKGD